MPKILITGMAGFIGMHLAERLVHEGDEVVGIDNLNNYYSVDLKKSRLNRIKDKVRFMEMDLVNREALRNLFRTEKFDFVVNLAAQAGVRYSLVNPHSYVDSNVAGFVNLLEMVREFPVKHLIFASSSSVYGANTKVPYHEEDPVNFPVSLYAATKRSNELMGFTYSHLFRIPMTGLRFFTVYGPWGRPDMAYFSFTEDILAGRPIKLFNNGRNLRDFTYVDDIIESILRLLPKSPKEEEQKVDGLPQGVPWRILNIGGGKPIIVTEFLSTLESCLGLKSVIELVEAQPGDVYQTCSDASNLEKLISYTPTTSLKDGLATFVMWHKEYYGRLG